MVRIFVVDDSATIRQHLRTALEESDDWVVVGEADNGRHAVEAWPKPSPNVTLMDFIMPEMDGLEASRRLSQQHPEAPILMVTTDPSRQLEEEAKKAGAKGLVQKSDVQSLTAAVRMLLKGKTYFHQELAAA